MPAHIFFLILEGKIAEYVFFLKVMELVVDDSDGFLSYFQFEKCFHIAHKTVTIVMLWGKWPSQLRCCDRIGSFPSSNHTRYLVGLRDPNSL